MYYITSAQRHTRACCVSAHTLGGQWSAALAWPPVPPEEFELSADGLCRGRLVSNLSCLSSLWAKLGLVCEHKAREKILQIFCINTRHRLVRRSRERGSELRALETSCCCRH